MNYVMVIRNNGQPAFIRPDRVDMVTASQDIPMDSFIHLSNGTIIQVKDHEPAEIAELLWGVDQQKPARPPLPEFNPGTDRTPPMVRRPGEARPFG